MNVGCDIQLIMKTRKICTKEEYSKQVKTLVDTGFKHYNFDFFAAEKTAPLYDDNYEKWFYDIKQALDEHGAKCVIGHEPVFFHFDLTDEEKMIQKRVLEGCKILGVDWLVMHPVDEDGDCSRAHMKKLADKNYEYFARYAEDLEKHNTGMAVETMTNVFKWHGGYGKRHYGDDPYDLIELIDRIGSDRIQICVDTGHLNTYGSVNFNDAIYDMGKRIKALHVHDNNSLSDEHVLPFMGNIDWRQFIHALRDIGYEGVFTYEAGKIPSMYPEELIPSWLKLKYDIAQYIVNMD